MDDNSLMPFGKHKGKKLEDVPDDYLYWLYGQGIDLKYYELEDYINDNYDSIVAIMNKNRTYNKFE